MEVQDIDLGYEVGLEAVAECIKNAIASGNGLRRAPLRIHRSGVKSAPMLSELVEAVGIESAKYTGGRSPRTALGDNVYTSTEYSAHASITQHQELSYEEDVPQFLFFLSLVAAEDGGATPLNSANELVHRLPDAVVDRFREKGVTYSQSLHAGDGMGKSWREAFDVSTPDECSHLLSEMGLDYSWSGETLSIVRHRPALRQVPGVAGDVWFNQADQWHPSALGDEKTVRRIRMANGGVLPYEVTFGDGEPISSEMIALISRTSREIASAETWQVEQLVVLDNVTTMHGRDPYRGSRKTLVAMGDLRAS